MKILDSDHCIAILRGNLNLAKQVGVHEPLATTTITIAELIHGAHKSKQTAKNVAAVETLLAGLTILPFDAKAGRVFGRVKAELEKQGISIATADLQIAAIALSHQLPVVTHNTKHFGRVPGLILEDWLEGGEMMNDER